MARNPKSPANPIRAAADRGEIGAIEPAKTRKRTIPTAERKPGPTALREENTISPAKTRERRSRTADVEPPAKLILTKGELPAAVARRYNAEPGLFRRHIDYYEGGGATKPAFRDRGDKLVAFQNDPATVGSLVAIARHRGWSSLDVRGDDTFRREVWKEAQKLGIKIKGYRPKARERDQVAKEAQAKTEKVKGASHAGPRGKQAKRAAIEPAPAPPPSATVAKRVRPDFDKGVTGVLLEHGAAPYRHKAGASLTPFVRLDMGAAKPLEVWGVGLPAALLASKARLGDQLTLRRDGVDQVEIRTNEPGAPPRDVQRNRWSATAERFQQSNSGKAARDPDLASAQARLAVVETVARTKLADPKDRARVVAGAKTRIAKHLAEGRTFAEPKIAEPRKARDRAQSNDPVESRGPERVRGR